MLVSMPEWWVDALMTCSAVGSKTTTSASEPGINTPLRGYKLNACAAAVLVSRTKSEGVINPVWQTMALTCLQRHFNDFYMC